MPDGPDIGSKLLFWLIVGAVSVFFAEVISSSFPLALVHPWGYLVLIPLYGLHTLVLGRLVFRGRPTFSTLFIAGALFGLYEAYITKVLFYPPWGRSAWHYLGVDLFWTLILVTWWHMFFAFIIPLFVSERILGSDEMMAYFPERVRRFFGSPTRAKVALYLFIIWSAAFMGGNMGSFYMPSVAAMLNLAVLAILVVIWKRRGRRYTLEEMLPEGRQFWILFALLLLVYLVLGLIFDTSKIPGLSGQLVILGLYALFLVMLAIGVRGSKKARKGRWKGWKADIKIRDITVLSVLFISISVLSSITPIGVIVMVSSFVMGILVGIFSLFYSVTRILLSVRN
ncbi:MAG: hypothetical protein KAH57_07140 [Thermoplasmata archaeon]|nr:hypothetical protein [Thermoplasmata archaeon]